MRIFLALLFIFGSATLVRAEERITSFTSDVTVNRDSSLLVHETVAVLAEGNAIKRGIFRDIPTIYSARNGIRFNTRLDVLNVGRDGHDEPFSVLDIANGKRIRIGSADRLIDPGPHRYEITYRTTRQIAFLEKFDELYWNVTGNGWELAIDKAVAIIRLPQGTPIIRSDAYTGPQGAQGKDFRVITASPGFYQAETTRRLAPGEGFTVAVAFPKGVLTPPSPSEEAANFLSDNIGMLAVVLGIAAVFLYYLYAWSRVGRDPPAGAIVPLFAPPAGLGPGGVRYVRRQGFDDRTFAASLVGLAVKGRLKIIDEDKGFAVTRLANQGPPLTRAEAALYNAIPAGTTELKQVNHSTVSAMRKVLDDALEKEHEGAAFMRNVGWFWLGTAITIAVLVVSALFLPGEDASAGLFLVLWVGIWWGVIIAVGWSVVKGIFGGRGFMRRIGSIFGGLFLLPFVFGGIAGPAAMLTGEGSSGLYFLAAGAIALIIMNALFHRLLRAPTMAGRKLLDRIEGFRMYLATAEEERLRLLNPPEKTPELFERYLPYALALDCENEWNDKFAAVLMAAAATTAGAAGPIWYSGRNWDAGRTGGFATSLGSSLAASTAAAAVAPGSSSYSGGGSGGGGSSGGGGGGGGGGGW